MDATNHKTNQRKTNQMAPTIKFMGEGKSHQVYFINFFGQNLDATYTPSVIRRWIRDVVYRHRRSRCSHPLVVGVGVQWTPQDVRKLEITRHRLEIGELLDVRKYLADQQGRSLRGRSFEGIVEECMGLEGVRLDRKISKSDWSVDYLSKEQLVQVSVDAYVSFKLGVDARLWQSVIVFPSLLHISELVKQIKWLQRSEPSRTTNLTIPLCRFLWRRFDSTLTPPTLDDGSETSSIYSHRRSRSCHPLVVGVGVQWTPHPHGISHPRRVTTVLRILSSYAWEHHVLSSSSLTRVPDIIPRFLTDPNTTFVGIRNCQDAKRLARTRHQLEIGELLDARMYVVDSQGRSLRGRSFEEIVEKCMGFRGVKLDRGISRSDWSVEYLSNDQILQVSVDAYVCFKLDVSARLWQVKF
ncbi:LOW QUALITY PROTEIN: hypothetical protein HID58_003477 [Brassica napus]|uniref:3'-5' exonuclease domain-containing protein n=1 Tax=Brassica napus TaxID=3708 RepID=A0ABQ8ET74_BRANA|nr:LOW QUALITY PROTEIN: hypothetical protein HID58_003477 [Brassica napus]